MNREALVVGINRYPMLKDKPTSKPRHLMKSAADAEAIAQFLETYGNFRVQRLPAINIEGSWQVDSDPAPRNLIQAQDLKKAIANLFNPPSSSIPDTALLFFAGHGLRSHEGGVTEGFLGTSEANPLRGKWGLSLQWLRQLLQESPVRQQIVWLDCCHSGELLNFAEADPGSRGKARDRCLIAASRDFEVAYEEVGGEHGILTSALLQGLKPENHAESWVTNYSLVDFINKQLATSRQRPIFHNSGGEIILTGEKEKIERAVLMAGVCPYKGLQAFDFNDEDAKYFKGRTALTDLLLDKVRESNFLAVMGASGSGKSSVVKAGLLYQLKLGQRLSGSETWPILIVRPGEHPLKSLARVFVEENLTPPTPLPYEGTEENDTPLLVGSGSSQLEKAEELIAAGAVGLRELVKAKLSKTSETRFFQKTGFLTQKTGFLNQRVVLVIDQFEECFTLCGDIEERQKFFECILGAIKQTDTQLCLVITMRADFFGKCAEQEYAGLSRLIQDSQVTVTPMNREEMEEAITEPAIMVGLEMQRELVEQMLQDVEKSPGMLPLLQYTLTELWQRRQVNRLTLAEYTKLGGVKGTLQNRADEVYQKLSQEEQLTTKRIFLELTQLGEGTEDTRRQIFKSDLVSEKNPQVLVDAVLNQLTDARLLVTSELAARGEAKKTETVVDVAHEALIRYWPLLRNWVNENRDAIRIERKIEAEAEDWERKKKPKDDLLVGSKLVEAENYLKDYAELGLLSSLGKEFIEKSIRRRRNNRRRNVGIVAVFVGAMSAAAVGSTILWFNAEKETVVATLGEKAATVKNLLDVNPVNGLVLAIGATGESKDKLPEVLPSVQSSLLSAIQVPQERNLFKGHENRVTSVAFSRDGKYIVSGSFDKTVRLWDIKGNLIGQPFKGHQDRVTSVAFSRDGKYIVSGSFDKTVRLWDIKGNLIGQPFKGHQDVVYSVAFSPDGKYIVSGSADKTVRLWDIKGNPIGQPFIGHQNYVNSVAFSPDGKYIVSGSLDNTVRLWDIKGNLISQPFVGHQQFVTSVAFSPDGKSIVSGSADKTVRLWDIKGQPFVGHQSAVYSVAFSPDGKYIVSGSDDKTVRLWDIKGKPIAQPFVGHQGIVNSVAFSPDGKYIVFGGEDKTVRLWDIKGNPIGQPFVGHQNYVYSVAFSPDGKYIVSGSWDNTVRLWDIKGNLIGQPFQGHQNYVTSVAFSPDGKSIVSGSLDNTVRLWDIKGNLISQPFVGHQSYVNSVAFSPDGKSIVSGSDDKTVRLWEIKGKPIGQPIGQPFVGHQDGVSSVAFSPDGKYIVSGSRDNTVRLWQAGDWQTWLSVGCDRLREHPVLVHPENEDQKSAAQTCRKYVWKEADASK
ncbi:caspase family protein [Planktothrix sp. FACHB-1375]|uniref:Caspase family protein n=3 Tax=Oscillatoriophycideae TaxID=1301283 RepID=A0A926VI08_9CYAN|nr:caspase family protein [Aerosakkonema funiforme FACHB-1375]